MPFAQSASPEESRAAAVVAAVTDCTARYFDVGGGVQRPDFNLFAPDGRHVGVLEVTTIRSRAHMSFFSAKTRKHRSWRDVNLRSHWIVTVDRADRRLQYLQAPVSAALSEFEDTGVSWAVSRPEVYSVSVHPLPAALRDLGVVEARAVRGANEGSVTINVWPTGGGYGIESATEALESVLNLPDNRKKLGGGLERRELFVWIDPPSLAASALGTYSGPLWRSKVEGSRTPNLPPEATAIWAALWSDGKARLASALWWGSRSGWKVLDPP